MKFQDLFDSLYFRQDLAWPANDRPNEFLICRVANWISVHHGATSCFFEQLDAQYRQGMLLAYIRFEGLDFECQWTKPDTAALQKCLIEGLEAWDAYQSVRFNEEITSFFDVGPSASRTFLNPERRMEIAGILEQKVLLPADLVPVARRYTAARLASRQEGHSLAQTPE